MKAEPPHIDALVREHANARPGRYFDKHHRVSIGAVDSVSVPLVAALVRDSYDLVAMQLPADTREELASASEA